MDPVANIPSAVSPRWADSIERVRRALKVGALPFDDIRWLCRMNMGGFELRNTLAAGEGTVFTYEKKLNRWRLIGEPFKLGKIDRSIRPKRRRRKNLRPSVDDVFGGHEG